MKAYNSRKMSKERIRANKGSLRVSFVVETVNPIIVKVKEGFEIIYPGKYHSICKKRNSAIYEKMHKIG
ncbi:MAG: hypothetical protein ACRCZH_06595 [Cetobacterium sp.]